MMKVIIYKPCFGGVDKLYRVLKNQPHIAYQSLYLSVFLSFQ